MYAVGKLCSDMSINWLILVVGTHRKMVRDRSHRGTETNGKDCGSNPCTMCKNSLKKFYSPRKIGENNQIWTHLA